MKTDKKIDRSVLERLADEYGARGLLVVSIDKGHLHCTTFASDPAAWGHVKEVEFVLRKHIDSSWQFSQDEVSYSIVRDGK